MLPKLSYAFRVFDELEPHGESPQAKGYLRGLSALLRKIPVSQEVRELACHARASVRAAVAAGLCPEDEAALLLLRSLAADPDPDVRRSARERLKEQEEVPWWVGLFSKDPLLALSPEEASRYKEVFEALARFAALPPSNARNERLAQQAASLPPPLPLDLASQAMTSYDAVRRGGFGALGALLLSQPQGAKAAAKLLERWGREPWGFEAGDKMGELLRLLPEEKALGVCRELLSFCLEKAREAPEQRAQARELSELLADAVGHGWPTGVEATEVLDALLSVPYPASGGYDPVYGLTAALTRPGKDPTPYLERLLEAHLADYPGPWKRLSALGKGILAEAPPEALRPVAEQALQSDSPALLRWGLSQLLGPLYDKERDPSPTDFLQRLSQEPKYRRVLCLSPDLLPMALPHLRAELRAGRLRFLEAFHVLSRAGYIFGGRLTIEDPMWERVPFPREVVHPEERRRKYLETYRDFLGPESLKGPPTEEEWKAYWTARAACDFSAPVDSLEELGLWRYALLLFPEGPFGHEDRAFLARAVESWRKGDEWAGCFVVPALALRGTEEDLATIRELFSDPQIMGSPWRAYFRRVARRLGLSPGDGKSGSAGVDWMDEPEEEDDEG